MLDKIKVGDVVQLRSGGIAMTVTEVRPSVDMPNELLAECNWFEQTESCGQKREWTTFPIAALKKINE